MTSRLLDRLPGLTWTVSLVLLALAFVLARWFRPDADLAVTVLGRGSAALAAMGFVLLAWRHLVARKLHSA